MTTNHLAPVIRFKGFTDAWEQRKAKDIFKPLVEKNRKELPVLSVTQDMGVVYREDVGIDIKYDLNTLNNYKVVKPNDFIISLRSFQGGFELSDKLGIVSPAYTIFNALEERNNYSLFWKVFFKRFIFIESLKTVTFGIRDGKSISFTEFGDLKLAFANLEEQTKIGNFFKQLDDTIALHQRELDLLKEQKKGFLQKMFPKKDELVPEIRFAGFTDAWEQRKLGEVINFLNGRAYKQKELLDTGKYRVLRVGNFNTNDRWYYSDLELDNNKYADKGDLLYLWATNFGPEIWNEERVIYHYHIWKLQFLSNEIDKLYLYTWLLTDKERIKLTTNGTTMVHVTKGGMEQRVFQYPKSIDEQTKIGSFFKQLDDTIALHQCELEKLQEMKKAFLQKMFV